MTQSTTHKPAGSSSTGLNPFARAMAEARGDQADESLLPKQGNTNSSGNFNGGGGSFGENNWDETMPNGQPNHFDMAEQQRLQAEKLKRERLRQQLHRQVNPVETRDVFNARQQHIKKEIEQIRHELRLLAKEVIDFHKEIDVTLTTNIGDVGDGKYYITFFQKLREFIMLLRHKVQSAKTWATTMNSKKKRKKGMIGLEVGGKQHEQTATIFDQMHHERSTAYSGS